MALLSLRDVSLAWGDTSILDSATLHVDSGERIALLGRNGAGKSTLLRLIGGGLKPDGGEIRLASGHRLAMLDQNVPDDLSGDLFDVVARGVPEVGELLAEHHHLSHELATDSADGHEAVMARLEQVQERLETTGGWHHERRVETTLSRLQLPSEGSFETLSGGLKRRVLLARALVGEPDLLLLDEPTNHLDIPAIEWLEELLAQWSGSLIFVTHDRSFLRRLATRIVELDRGQITDWPGDYAKYLELQEHRLAVEADHAAKFDKRLAQEEAWIRQGIKARRTRNEGRVRALEKLRATAQARRGRQGTANLRMDQAGRSGKKVIEVESLSFAYDDGEILIEDLSTKIMRGDKIGILGPNGSGKTTLLRLMLGKLEPQGGDVSHGTKLEIAYFDQHRELLDDTRSVADNVADGNDRVVVGGQNRHIISYLESFLFPPQQSRSPVSTLSGGERNRLMLARLFTRPFNLLVMDEPTNDLDIETLELLESMLVEFTGTLLLVSHDRAFLDNVVASTLVMEGNGRVGEYAGGYTGAMEQQRASHAAIEAEKPQAEKPKASSRTTQKRQQKSRKLSYREKQDLEELPGHIESLETEQAALHEQMADPDFYRHGNGDAVVAAKDRLQAIGAKLEVAYDRWAELEEPG